MSKFIEVTTYDGKRFINTDHIIDVWDNKELGCVIYTDDVIENQNDYPHIDIKETYEQVKALITGA